MLVVLYGKTGSGKSTIAKRLNKRFGFHLAISATSRPPRKHEVDGVHYYFKTVDEMQKLFFTDHKLAELNTYMGNYYGLPISEISGSTKIAVMEPDGIRALIAGNYDVVPIYIDVSTKDQLEFLRNDMTRYPEETKQRISEGDTKFTDEAKALAGNNVVTNSADKNINEICREIIEIIKNEETKRSNSRTTKEIERRWLVSEQNANMIINSLGEKVYYQVIDQIYKLDEKFRHIHLPGVKDIFTRIIKTPCDNSGDVFKISTETITDISPEYWRIATQDVITLQKIRYLIPINGVNIELDVFSVYNDSNNSTDKFYIAEIEFESEKDASEFIPFDWFDREITNDKNMSNRKIFEYLNSVNASEWIENFKVVNNN